MWNVRRGKIFPVTAPTAAKRLLPQEYFVRAAANGFNTEEMGHEMTRQQMEQIRMESMKQYGFGPETMKQLKVCANCGAIVPAEKQICGECGFPGKHFTRYTLICTVAVRYVKPYFLTTQFFAPSAGQCSQQSANEKMKAF